MNFIEGVLGRDTGGAFVELPGGVRLAVPTMASGVAGQKVVFGVRPEHCALARGDAGVAVQVEVVEPTGANIQVYTKLAGTPFCAIFAERHDFRPGQTIRLDFPADKIHLFDAQSGARL
jgi:multiple sugar transport system ATP-binding protein